jgi:hypothetical protein
MREYFSQFGKVIDSTVMLDRETGRSKGFGFISLEDVDVTPILGFGNLEIDGKLVRFPLFILNNNTHRMPRLTSSWRNPDINATTSRNQVKPMCNSSQQTGVISKQVTLAAAVVAALRSTLKHWLLSIPACSRSTVE